MPTTDPVQHQRLQQAAHWFSLFADSTGSKQQQRDFEQWLQSTDNQQAWGFVDGISQQFTQIRDSEHHDVALNALGSPEQARLARRNTLKLLSLLPLSAFLSWTSYKHTSFGAKLGTSLQASLAGYVNDYATDIGQIDHLTLADNSSISLNTASAINVRFNDKLRSIELVRGEILIDTATDPRHFEVTTSVARLRALGTRFNVRQFSDNQIQLSVFEGRVAIYHAASQTAYQALNQTQNQIVNGQAATPPPYIVATGQQVLISKNNIKPLAPANTKQISWQQGLLLADEITLAQFIEQVGRYRKGYLSVAPEIAELRIMGAFPINDTDKTLAMLSNSLPVKVENILPWWVTIEPK